MGGGLRGAILLLLLVASRSRLFQRIPVDGKETVCITPPDGRLRPWHEGRKRKLARTPPAARAAAANQPENS